MKKIGYYGGSFDPIHFGHINLALEMAEIHGLDCVLFCPANVNPHKDRDFISATSSEKLKMVEVAIEDIPHFKCIDLEIKRGGISYTVDTLKELKLKFKEDQLFLILGLDSALDFPNWKNPDEILTLATPLIGYRENNQENSDLSNHLNLLKKNLTKTSLLDISSSKIRQRIAHGKYIRHLVPSKVVDYIYENQLYSNSLSP